MRVAIVNHRDWIEGGMDKVALTHQRMLREHGHEAVIFSQFHQNNQPSPYRHLFPRNTERLQYRIPWSKLSQLPTDLRHTFYNPEAGHQFGTFLDRFMPDVIHVHGLPRAFSPSFYDEAHRRRIRLIQTHHYVKLICPTGKLLRGDRAYCTEMPCLTGSTGSCIIHRCQDASLPKSIISAFELQINRQRYIEQPDLHLAPSHYLKDLLSRAGVSAGKLRHHPNFVDTDRFFPAFQHHPEHGAYFLYAGRLVNEKGIATLLDAFGSIRDIPLFLAGDGPMASYCAERIVREELHHVRLLGQLDEETLVPWIQQARATLIPSLWGEIFGLSIIESFACATPVIGSRIGAIPELVNTGLNGFLVEPGDAEDLRDAVLRMANMPQQEAENMGLAGLALVHRGYRLEDHIQQLLSIYEEECVAV